MNVIQLCLVRESAARYYYDRHCATLCRWFGHTMRPHIVMLFCHFTMYLWYIDPRVLCIQLKLCDIIGLYGPLDQVNQYRWNYGYGWNKTGRLSCHIIDIDHQHMQIWVHSTRKPISQILLFNYPYILQIVWEWSSISSPFHKTANSLIEYNYRRNQQSKTNPSREIIRNWDGLSLSI